MRTVIKFFLLGCVLFTGACMHHGDHNPNPLDISYTAAFVVNGGSGNLSVIRMQDYVLTETIGLNGATFPHHIYLNPSKTKLAVAITGKDLSGGHGGHGEVIPGLKIQIIDAVSGQIEKEIPLGKMPHNGIFHPGGTELWLGQADDVKSKVLVYRTTDWSLQNTIEVGKGVSEITFSANGSLAFACNTDENSVSIIDAATKTVLQTLPTGAKPVGAWPGTGSNMFVDNEEGQSVTELLITDSVRLGSSIALGFKPGYAAWNTASEELWVSDASNGRVVFYKKAAGSEWTQTGSTLTGADAHAIAFSDDFKTAWITNQGAGTVSVLDANSHSVLKTIAVGQKPNGIVLK